MFRSSVLPERGPPGPHLCRYKDMSGPRRSALRQDGSLAMAQDRPTASELLAAIADLLREEVTPVLDKADPRLGFQMRVAANSLAILEREARLGPAADRASTSDW